MLMHRCPGCNDVEVNNAQFACKPCWFRLPLDIRQRINRAWRAGVVGRAAHVSAMRDATDWYRANPQRPVQHQR